MSLCTSKLKCCAYFSLFAYFVEAPYFICIFYIEKLDLSILIIVMTYQLQTVLWIVVLQLLLSAAVEIWQPIRPHHPFLHRDFLTALFDNGKLLTLAIFAWVHLYQSFSACLGFVVWSPRVAKPAFSTFVDITDCLSHVYVLVRLGAVRSSSFIRLSVNCSLRTSFQHIHFRLFYFYCVDIDARSY